MPANCIFRWADSFWLSRPARQRIATRQGIIASATLIATRWVMSASAAAIASQRIATRQGIIASATLIATRWVMSASAAAIASALASGGGGSRSA